MQVWKVWAELECLEDGDAVPAYSEPRELGSFLDRESASEFLDNLPLKDFPSFGIENQGTLNRENNA